LSSTQDLLNLELCILTSTAYDWYTLNFKNHWSIDSVQFQYNEVTYFLFLNKRSMFLKAFLNKDWMQNYFLLNSQLIRKIEGQNDLTFWEFQLHLL
jgi:hypothetical protein